MPTTIGSAYVQILPSADGIQGKLESVLGADVDGAGKSAGAGWSSAFLGGLGTLGKGIGAAVGALGAGATAAGGAFAAAASGVAQYGDNIDKASQKMGLSAEKYQEWDAILQHSGSSIGSMTASMKTLANAATTNNKAFEELGISQQELASLNQEQLFERTISALQGVEDTTKRTYLAGKLLGRGATELGPLLNTSAEDVEKMRQKVHELGGVMSDDAVKASAQFQDSLQDMQTAIGGFGRNMLSEFLPGLSGIMDGIGEIFAGSDGADKISQGVDNLITSAEKVLPKVFELGGKIVDRLGTALLDNAPRLIKMGADLLLSLVRGLIEKLPDVFQAAVEIIVTLSDALAEQLPELIPVAVEAILTLADGLILNADKLIIASLDIIVALAEGISNSIPILVEKAPVIISHLVEAIIKLLPIVLETGVKVLAILLEGIGQGIMKLDEMGANAVDRFVDGAKSWFGQVWNSGADMLDAFIDGIKARIRRLLETVKNVAQIVRDYLGFSEPEKGPLSNFHTYAPDMMKLFAQGIKDNAGLVSSALNDSLSAAPTAGYAQQYARGQNAVQTAQTARSGDSASRVVQVTVPLIVERREAARAIFELYEDEARRIGVRLAKGKGVTA